MVWGTFNAMICKNRYVQRLPAKSIHYWRPLTPRCNEIVQSLERWAHDRKILGTSPNHAELLALFPNLRMTELLIIPTSYTAPTSLRLRRSARYDGHVSEVGMYSPNSYASYINRNSCSSLGLSGQILSCKTCEFVWSGCLSCFMHA